MTSKEMEKLLLKNGFIFVRQKDFHRVFWNAETKRIGVVPMHAKELKIGMEQKILKEAGLK